MRTLALVAAPALLTLSVASGAAEPRYGVCRAQIDDFVRNELGQTPTRVDIQAYSERTPPRNFLDVGSALVYVKECAGYHAFEVRGTWELCEQIAHYGHSSGSYIRYEAGYEGCQRG